MHTHACTCTHAQIPAAATCSEWAPDSASLLLGLRDGRVLRLTAPQGPQVRGGVRWCVC